MSSSSSSTSTSAPTPTLSGSCLCGSITYTVDAIPPIYTVLCHCTNCKKATGTSFSTNSIYPKSALHITDARNTLKSYADGATDSGQPLFRYFCGHCGSPIKAETRLADGIVSLWAGGLDREKGKEGESESESEVWRPVREQYLESKDGWVPEFRDSICSRHERGIGQDVMGQLKAEGKV